MKIQDYCFIDSPNVLQSKLALKFKTKKKKTSIWMVSKIFNMMKEVNYFNVTILPTVL